jgi:hypothetical protein
MSISQNFPEEGPTLNLNFAGSKTLDPRITFARPSTSGDATYMDANGLIVTAAADEPRFDHRYVNGEIESLGLLVEERRINQIRNNTMQGAVVGTPGTAPTNWTPLNRSNLTWSIAGTGIDSGVYYVDLKLSGTANATQSPTFTFESGSQISASDEQTWSTSCFIKLVSGSTTGITQIILAQDERSTTYLTGGNSSNFLSSINSSTTNIFSSCRYSFSRTNTNASTTFLHPYLLVTPTNGAVIDITLRIGMPQTELGSFSTSVIPTSGSTATRNHDRVYYENVDQTEWFNKTEGTVVFEHTDVPYNSSTPVGYPAVGFARTSDGTSASSIQYYFTKNYGAAEYLVRITPGNDSANITPPGGTGSAAPASKVGFVYKADDYALVRNGSLVGIDTSGAVPDAYMLIFGMNSVTNIDNNWNAHLKNLQYYPTRLSNTVLQNLTK